MPMIASQVARALGGEASGNKILAPGPGHSKDDRSLSVIIDPTAPGGFLVNSFADDDPIACKDYVRQKLGMPAWEPPRAANGNGHSPGKRGSSIVAEYVYRDADGQPSRKVARTATKGFPQFRWTGSGWQGGKDAVKGVPLFPYRLPELLASGREPVFICEGEKDSDRLAGLGFVATTNPMGAGKWHTDLNRWFEGRECFVLADNDQPGRDHAADVAGHLSPIAASVRVVELPGLPDKGDVSDWLDVDTENAGRLLTVCRSFQEWTVPAADKAWPGILTSAAFLESFEAPDDLVDGLVHRRFLYSSTGATGSGKTAVALLLCACCATGLSFAGREVAGGRVLYFAGENPTDVQMRWDAMLGELKLAVADVDVHFIPGVFDIAGLEARVTSEVSRLGGVALVIIDTSAAYFLGDEENNNAQLGGHARTLRRLTNLPGGPCVIANCHPVKNASNDNLIPRGGGAFLAEVDGNITVARDDNVIRLHWQGKFRGPDFDPLTFELVNTQCPTLRDSKGRSLPTVIARALSMKEEQGREETARSDEDRLLLAMRDNPGASMNALLAELKWPNKSKVFRVMTRLKRDKFVVMKRNHWQLTRLGKAEAKRAETPV